ncbi:hypothetical protein U91I_00408 [alpha proteobacterium U9-1i]|nr:hypothetical protein U91I_00408 [alpha proteobacterium U9-1i]
MGAEQRLGPMLGGVSYRTGWGRSLAVIAFLAMAIRAIVPAGYMLSAADDGRYVTVTLCSEHGTVEALIDRQTGAVLDPDERPAPTQTPNQANDDAPCVFAFAAPLAAAEAPSLFVTRHTASVETQSFLRDARPGLGLAAPPPFSTGPPQAA